MKPLCRVSWSAPSGTPTSKMTLSASVRSPTAAGPNRSTFTDGMLCGGRNRSFRASSRDSPCESSELSCRNCSLWLSVRPCSNGLFSTVRDPRKNTVPRGEDGLPKGCVSLRPGCLAPGPGTCTAFSSSPSRVGPAPLGDVDPSPSKPSPDASMSSSSSVGDASR